MAVSAHEARRVVLGFMDETTEGSWLEPDAAAYYSTRLFDFGLDAEVRTFERKPLQQTFTTLPTFTSGRLARIRFRFELAGYGQTGWDTTNPAWFNALEGCGAQSAQAVQYDLDATPSAGLIPGEFCDESGGAEVVLFDWFTGSPDTVVVEILSGTPGVGDVFTGQKSGVEFTLDSATLNQTNVGRIIRPDSTVTSKSVGVWHPYGTGTAATQSQIVGTRGTWGLSGAIGEAVFVDCEMLGVFTDQLDDTAIPITPAYNPYAGLKFLGCEFQAIDQASTDIIFNSFSAALNHTLTPRDDANNDDGYLSVRMTDRAPAGTFDPEMAEEDGGDMRFFDQLKDGTLGKIGFQIDDSASSPADGDKVDVRMGYAGYTGYGMADRGGIQTLNMPFGFYGAGTQQDAEIMIWTH